MRSKSCGIKCWLGGHEGGDYFLCLLIIDVYSQEIVTSKIRAKKYKKTTLIL